MKLVDYYGASFTAFLLAVAELYTFCYIYSVDRLCKDVEFMLGFYPNLYWRICWKYITPGLMTIILIFSLTTLEPLKDNGKSYPEIAYFIGRCITCLGLLQLPIFAIYAISKQKQDTLIEVGTKEFHSLQFQTNHLFSENQKCIPSNCEVGTNRSNEVVAIQRIYK